MLGLNIVSFPAEQPQQSGQLTTHDHHHNDEYKGEINDIGSSRPVVVKTEEKMGLNTLPYDLLLNIAAYLDVYDIHALHLTSRTLYDFSTTRPVYRKLATDLLRRCRALPLKGFQRLTDLTTEQLIRSVNKATRYEVAWLHRAPRPLSTTPGPYPDFQSNYMDNADSTLPGSYIKADGVLEGLDDEGSEKEWYKVVSAPPGEDVDWLSPITSSYTLCATKSGKVVCWDVQTDKCLAEWNPGGGWELWKCRVEFEERTVYFTMARILSPSYDDERVMDFVLMRLTFSDSPSGARSLDPPIFSRVTDFKTTGVVMNVFLLDPSARLLSAFIWVASANTIGLYALLDWDKKEYVFIDTGIECLASSNWSCILYDGHIVVHCEESDSAFQHFYPLSMLALYAQPYASTDGVPVVSRRVAPYRALSKKFVFPRVVTREGYHSEIEVDSEVEQDLTQLGLVTRSSVAEAAAAAFEGTAIYDSARALLMNQLDVDDTTATLALGMESIDETRRFKYSVPIGPSTSNSAEAESSSTSSAVLSRHYPSSTVATYAPSSSTHSSLSGSGSPSTSTSTSTSASTSAPSTSSSASASASLNPPLTVVNYGELEGSPSAFEYAYSPYPHSHPLESGILNPHRDLHDSMDLEHVAPTRVVKESRFSSPLTPVRESPTPVVDRPDESTPLPPSVSYMAAIVILTDPLPQISSPAPAPQADAASPPPLPPAPQPSVQLLPNTTPIQTIAATTFTTTNPSSSTTTTTTTTTTAPITNPFPFPPWYPENAHFVRQWWPSLPGIPRVSCTVVLLTMHDQETHSTKYVLAQHYFRVPISRVEWRKGEEGELDVDVDVEFEGVGVGVGRKGRRGKMSGVVGGEKGKGKAKGNTKGKGKSKEGGGSASPRNGVAGEREGEEGGRAAPSANGSRSRGRRQSESYDAGDEDEDGFGDVDEAATSTTNGKRKKTCGKSREKIKLMKLRRRKRRETTSSDADVDMSSPYESDSMLDSCSEEDGVSNYADMDDEESDLDSDSALEASDNALMHLWYVSRPFEVVCVFDAGSDEDDEWAAGERPRPLVAVDFGHAVWIESVDPRVKALEEKEWEKERRRVGERKGVKKTSKSLEISYEDEGVDLGDALVDNRERWLRFVTFPPFSETGLREGKGKNARVARHGKRRDTKGKGRSPPVRDVEDLEDSAAGIRERQRVEEVQRCEGKVRTLDIPEELDLDSVETINIDQSQGAVILSTREGKIFILCYE